MAQGQYKILFSDIGGVLGTNGWDTRLRRDLCSQFQIDFEDMESRHRMMFDSFERGFMSFETYLSHVVFSSPRSFTLAEIQEYAYAASVPWQENIALEQRVKNLNSLKLALISNEGEGITDNRIRKFELRALADFMVISHFVHFRKPDPEIWRLALNLAGVTAQESIYIDDRETFVWVASQMGFTAIHHVSLEETERHFRRLGLQTE